MHRDGHLSRHSAAERGASPRAQGASSVGQVTLNVTIMPLVTWGGLPMKLAPT